MEHAMNKKKYIHTHIYTHQPTCTHTYIRTYIHAYMHTYIHTYAPTCTCTYIHTHTRTYIHTYTQSIWTCREVILSDKSLRPFRLTAGSTAIAAVPICHESVSPPSSWIGLYCRLYRGFTHSSQKLLETSCFRLQTRVTPNKQVLLAKLKVQHHEVSFQLFFRSRIIAIQFVRWRAS
jgi:hypothetical protein